MEELISEPRSRPIFLPENFANHMTNSKGPAVVLLGPPGCGKGTQARELSKKVGFVHISTGDMLRRTATLSTPLGKLVRNTMDAGEFLSDDLVCQLVAAHVADPDCDQGLVFDGFPRTLDQARFLCPLLSNSGRAMIAIRLHLREPTW